MCEVLLLSKIADEQHHKNVDAIVHVQLTTKRYQLRKEGINQIMTKKEEDNIEE